MRTQLSPRSDRAHQSPCQPGLSHPRGALAAAASPSQTLRWLLQTIWDYYATAICLCGVPAVPVGGGGWGAGREEASGAGLGPARPCWGTRRARALGPQGQGRAPEPGSELAPS